MAQHDETIEKLPLERRHDYNDFVDAIQASNIRMAQMTASFDIVQKELLEKHKCRFGEDEARAMHMFAQSMANGGWRKFSAVLDFGDTLIQMRKVGTAAFIIAMVGAVLGVIWLGIKQKLAGTP